MNRIPVCFLLLLLTICTKDSWSQDTLIDYPSMRNVFPKVNAQVINIQSEHRYLYRVSNGDAAQQRISDLMVEVKTDSFINTPPGTNWDASNARRPSILAATWGSLDSTADIWPGTTKSGFMIVSKGLPSISRFYCLGWVEIPEGELPFRKETADIFVNSAQGFTVSPADPPMSFSGLTFLDSIKSYINRSRSLGWITNDPTANKYTRLVDSARSNLQTNKIAGAKTHLDTLLSNVNKDSSITLTSEAYALLRFNTEYVLKKLREEDSAFDKKKR